MNPLTRIVIIHGFKVADEVKAAVVLITADCLSDVKSLEEALAPYASKPVIVTSNPRRFARLEDKLRALVPIAGVQLSRTDQIKMSSLIALGRNLLGPDDTMVCLAGAGPDLDTVAVVHPGREYERFLETP